MKKDTDEIIVDLHGSDNASVRKLTEEEQVQMRKLQKELRKELGIEDNYTSDQSSAAPAQNKEIDAFVEADEVEEKPANITVDAEVIEQNNLGESVSTEQADNVADEQPTEQQPQELLDENTQEEHTDNYEAFFKQYSKKDENLDSTNFGKYNSDLDFKLNSKIKRIRLPMPKKLKILVVCLAVLVAVAASVGLGLGLYKKPDKVYIASIAITQRKVGDEYIVDGKFTGDKLSYDHIYLICTYSNGTVKRVPITSDMATKIEGNINVDGQFVNAGNVLVDITYGGKTLKLKYVVEQKQIESISVFSTNFTITGTSVDLTNKIMVIVNYKNATSEIVDINDCTYQLDIGTGEKHLNSGVLEVGNKDTRYHTLQITYAGNSANISVMVNQH